MQVVVEVALEIMAVAKHLYVLQMAVAAVLVVAVLVDLKVLVQKMVQMAVLI
jgi:hypothetical protein